MKYAVRYFTRTGNTEKLAVEVAKELGVPALTTSTPLTEHVDYLFLGSSVYAAGVDDEIINFIKNNRNNIGQIVNISTAALLPSTYKQVSKLATENGIKMSEKEFHCRGSFAMMHKNHPDATDIENARLFAREFN